MRHDRIAHDAYSTPLPLADWTVQRAVSLLGLAPPPSSSAVLFWAGPALHRMLAALGRAELRTGWIDPEALDAAYLAARAGGGVNA